MRKYWVKDAVFSLKLRGDLFTLAQMPFSPYLMFFDISSKDGLWKIVSLNQVEPLFCVPVATSRLRRLVARKIPSALVKPRTKPVERRLIRPRLNFCGRFLFKGGDLIRIDTDRGTYYGQPVIKRDLSVKRDKGTIQKYELTNMWVNPQELKERLIRYFDTGVNWDPYKEKVFPGITPPSPLKKARSR